MPLVVELKDVTKTYGPVRALVGVSCQFIEGRAVVVRGPNGSGKSTLLALLGALARPTSGQVDYGELGGRRVDVRRTLGWLGHDSLCYPDLTGRENIELAARLHGRDPRASYTRAVERFDLGGFAGRARSTYSRGQRLLLLDEPTTGLDSAGAAKLVEVVREEAVRGATVVVVTHDAAFEEAVASEVVALERGRRV